MKTIHVFGARPLKFLRFVSLFHFCFAHPQYNVLHIISVSCVRTRMYHLAAAGRSIRGARCTCVWPSAYIYIGTFTVFCCRPVVRDTIFFFTSVFFFSIYTILLNSWDDVVAAGSVSAPVCEWNWNTKIKKKRIYWRGEKRFCLSQKCQCVESTRSCEKQKIDFCARFGQSKISEKNKEKREYVRFGIYRGWRSRFVSGLFIDHC